MKSIKPRGERRIVSLDEAMKRAEGYIPPEKSVKTGMDKINEDLTAKLPLDLRILDIEEGWISHNEHYRFDESLKALKERGYRRHLKPAEIFQLLIQKYHGYLPEHLSNIADDVMVSGGEWLDAVWYRDGPYLLWYRDAPQVKAENHLEYTFVNPADKDSEADIFEIGSSSSNKGIPLDQFSNDLIKKIYGCNLEDLPVTFRQGDNSSIIFLPKNNTVSPMARGTALGRYCIITEIYAASRGCRRR